MGYYDDQSQWQFSDERNGDSAGGTGTYWVNQNAGDRMSGAGMTPWEMDALYKQIWQNTPGDVDAKLSAIAQQGGGNVGAVQWAQKNGIDLSNSGVAIANQQAMNDKGGIGGFIGRTVGPFIKPAVTAGAGILSGMAAAPYLGLGGASAAAPTSSAVGGTAGGDLGFGAATYGTGASTPAMTTMGAGIGSYGVPTATLGGVGAAGAAGMGLEQMSGAEMNPNGAMAPSGIQSQPLPTYGPNVPAGPGGVDLTNGLGEVGAGGGTNYSTLDWSGFGGGPAAEPITSNFVASGGMNPMTGGPMAAGMSGSGAAATGLGMNVPTAQLGLGLLGAGLSMSGAEDMEDQLHAQQEQMNKRPEYPYQMNWDLVDQYLRDPMSILKNNPGYLASVDFIDKEGRRKMAQGGYNASGNKVHYLADALGKNASKWHEQMWNPIKDAAGLSNPQDPARIAQVGMNATTAVHNAKQGALGDLFDVGGKALPSIFKFLS